MRPHRWHKEKCMIEMTASDLASYTCRCAHKIPEHNITPLNLPLNISAPSSTVTNSRQLFELQKTTKYLQNKEKELRRQTDQLRKVLERFRNRKQKIISLPREDRASITKTLKESFMRLDHDVEEVEETKQSGVSKYAQYEHSCASKDSQFEHDCVSKHVQFRYRTDSKEVQLDRHNFNSNTSQTYVARENKMIQEGKKVKRKDEVICTECNNQMREGIRGSGEAPAIVNPCRCDSKISHTSVAMPNDGCNCSTGPTQQAFNAVSVSLLLMAACLACLPVVCCFALCKCCLCLCCYKVF